MASQILTQSQLKNLLHYDPLTGIFRWRVERLDGAIKPWSIAGSKKQRGVVDIAISKRLHKAHRLAWLYMTGDDPVHEVDHRDGNPFNNSWINLRAATHKQNGENIKQRSDNTSGFRGVSFNKQNKKFQAYVRHHGKRTHVGYFDNVEQAAEAVKAKRDELFTHDDGRAA